MDDCGEVVSVLGDGFVDVLWTSGKQFKHVGNLRLVKPRGLAAVITSS